MDFPAGFALERVLLNHPARAETRILIREYDKKEHTAVFQLIPSPPEECRPLVLPEQVEDTETVDTVIHGIVKGHIQHRSLVIANL